MMQQTEDRVSGWTGLSFLAYGPQDTKVKRAVARVVGRIANTRLASKLMLRSGEALLHLSAYMYARRRMVMVGYDLPAPENRHVIDRIRRIKEERELLQWEREAYQVYRAVEATAKIAGDIAEVGVYRGGSARLICDAKGQRELHLFDTFSGLPRIDAVDGPSLRVGQFAASYEGVKQYLSDQQQVHLYPGIFPETAGPVAERRFSFVHLDVDTHVSTRDCLEFFVPRMNAGAIVLSHNYSDCAGVKKAFDDYFAKRSEPIIELPFSQCLVVKGSAETVQLS
jgi:O-methyltransferase